MEKLIRFAYWLFILFLIVAATLPLAYGIYSEIDRKTANLLSKMADRFVVHNPVAVVTIFIVFITAAVAGVVFPHALFVLRNYEKKKKLSAIGQKHPATVLNIQRTGMFINDQPYVQLIVEIKPGLKTMVEAVTLRACPKSAYFKAKNNNEPECT